MSIHSISLKRFLSYGDQTISLPLEPLNVFIGPNGSGKSNLIEAIRFFRASPTELTSPVRDEGGGIQDWLWKGDGKGVAKIELLIDGPIKALRHQIAFTAPSGRFELYDERIENAQADAGKDRPYFYYHYDCGHPVINVQEKTRSLRHEDVKPDESILSQRRDPDSYPEITYLGDQYTNFRIYRDWNFGRDTPIRRLQKTDARNDFLNENYDNLGLVLNSLERTPAVKRDIVEQLQNLYPQVSDFKILVEGGTVQVFLQEGDNLIPATRLSDGTLRYLALLTILCHPKPPPLICIEEPELGLHPDALGSLGDLLIAASKRTQLIITTHSDILVDSLSGTPESIVICEQHSEGSQLRRLKKEDMAKWLEDYSLGKLWRDGELGGNRW